MWHSYSQWDSIPGYLLHCGAENLSVALEAAGNYLTIPRVEPVWEWSPPRGKEGQEMEREARQALITLSEPWVQLCLNQSIALPFHEPFWDSVPCSWKTPDLSLSYYSQSWSGNDQNSYLIRLLGGLNKLVHVQSWHSARHQVLVRSVNVGRHYQWSSVWIPKAHMDGTQADSAERYLGLRKGLK